MKTNYLWLMRLGARVRFTVGGNEVFGRVDGWSRTGLDLRETRIAVVTDDGVDHLVSPEELKPVSPLDELGNCASGDDTCLDDSSQ